MTNKRPGRPVGSGLKPTEKKQTVRVTVLFTPEEKEALEIKAQRCGKTASEYIRDLIQKDRS